MEMDIIWDGCMKEKGIKLQITVSEENSELIEKEVEDLCSTKTKLLNKIISDYFRSKKNELSSKKVIDLDLK